MCCVGTIHVASVADEVAVAGKSSVSELIDDLDSSAHGGVFYDGNGVLHILATDQELLLKSWRLQNAFRNREMEIVIEEAEHSLDELESAQEQLLEHQDELEIIAVGLYEPENALSVYTSDISDENKAAIASVAGMKNIRYKESSGFVASPANGDFEEMNGESPENSNIVGRADVIRPGQWVYMSRTGSNWSTLMVPCVRDYQESTQQTGFLTVGHGWIAGDSASVGGKAMGTVKNVWRGTYTDASFIPSNRSQSLTTASGKLIKYTGKPVSGNRVYMIGANGEKAAKILDTNVTFTMGARTTPPKYSQHTTYKCFTYSVPSIAGDSGGAMISPSSSDYEINGYNIGYFSDTQEGAACNWFSLADAYNILPAQIQ